MSEEELEQIIEKARIDRFDRLDIRKQNITILPDSIGSLTNLRILNLDKNQLTALPESIGNLTNLTSLNLMENQLTILPESIGNLTNLNSLVLDYNQLAKLPETIVNLTKLEFLTIDYNRLINLPPKIGNLIHLNLLYLESNQITELPNSISDLTSLETLDLDKNLLSNLSALQELPKLESVYLFSINLPRRYWVEFSEWKSEWLLDEENIEIRQRLIQQIGYERICQELDAEELDSWREYTLLKIDDAERFYDEDTEEEISREPMVLFKMTCPSTGHIHILRVPPEMTSAEAAITWVNHGIHPDEFAVQT